MHGSSSSSSSGDGGAVESVGVVSIRKCWFSSISSLDMNGSVINSEIEESDRLMIYGIGTLYIICTIIYV
jgi:hypothetical protein